MAVVADSLLERVMDELAGAGYGLIQLPPGELTATTAGAWIEQVAEHVAEFVRNGYEVVLVDDGRHGAVLNAALAALDTAALPQYAIQPPSTSRLTPET